MSEQGKSGWERLADELAECFAVDWGSNDVDGTEKFTVDTPKIAALLEKRDREREAALKCQCIEAVRTAFARRESYGGSWAAQMRYAESAILALHPDASRLLEVRELGAMLQEHESWCSVCVERLLDSSAGYMSKRDQSCQRHADLKRQIAEKERVARESEKV